MFDFVQYRRWQIAELRPYVNGEELSDRVSISAPDREAGSPKPGDMIARNPKNHDDQWLVAAKYFADNFEPIAIAPMLAAQGKASEERDELPGAMQLAIGVRDGTWPHSTDAQVWARKWLETLEQNPAIATDEGAIIGWFANAIMAGYDTATLRAHREPPQGEDGKLLYDIYHCAFHLLDDAGEGPEPDHFEVDAQRMRDLSAAIDAFEAKHPHPRDWVHCSPEQFASQPPKCSPDAAESADDICPNCVSPWKCNGPHIGERPATGYDYQDVQPVAQPSDNAHAALMKISKAMENPCLEIRDDQTIEGALADFVIGRMAQMVAPEGYALVPIEPTPAMCRAATMLAPTWDDTVSATKYKAMLAAAPTPSQKESGNG